ncbi:MAG TPA: tetratricopeptide repeat protein, partial [Bryobacteraceae bacterium]
ILDLMICIALSLATLAVYARVGGYDFVNFDDALYVADNPAVRAGLTPASIRWAFTGVVASNWHPVTLLSLMLDEQLFGLHPEAHHLMNVLYHVLAALTLYLLMLRATQARGPSAFAAFIFALHPLHVESVAWIAERKDVLSTLFFFLALYAYIFYTEMPTVRRYLLVAGLFALGLMSKPMLVTFPFVLLLFDYWPLRRFALPKVLWEKLPLLALSAAASFVTYRVQQTTGAVADTASLDGRLANALITYLLYIRQTVWPVHLIVFYPQPKFILATRAGVALLVLLAITVMAVRFRRTRPYWVTGWFWYLGTLVPVIGVVTVGQQSHADRYTYIPMVGLTLMAAWTAVDLVARRPRLKPAVLGAAVFCAVACAAVSWRQVGYWQNSETLYDHAIEVVPDNWLAHSNLGAYLMNFPERSSDTLEHLETAIRVHPGYAQAENNLALCLARANLCSAAIPHFEAALRSKPDLVQAHNNLAMCQIEGGQYGPAIAHLTTALRMQPEYAEAYFNLASALSKIPGGDAQAILEYEAGLRVTRDPDSQGTALAHRYLGELLAKLGRYGEALPHLEAAQRIHSDVEITREIERVREQAAGRK